MGTNGPTALVSPTGASPMRNHAAKPSQTRIPPSAGTSWPHRLGFSAGSSPMCNHAAKPNQTRTLLLVGHIPAPMEVDDRPCEAVLAGSPVIATHNMLCHGGPGGGWPCRLNSAAPRPLCYFLRGESRAIINKSLAREKHPCKALCLQAEVPPCGAAKGLSDRPLDVFGARPIIVL